MAYNIHTVSGKIVPNQDGNILITALLMLLVMNLLAIGIMQVSMRISKSANFETIDSEVFQVTDSCVEDVVAWLKTQTATPTILPSIAISNLNFMLTGSETQLMRNNLTGYTYGCTLAPYASGSSDSSLSANTGEEVGGNDGYGSTGDLSQKTYYKVTSTGGGPKNAVKVIYTIVSAEY